MSALQRWSVPGEDLPLVVAVAATTVGIATAFAAAVLWSKQPTATAPTAPSIAVAAVVDAPVVHADVVVDAAPIAVPTPDAAVAPAATSSCAPLIVNFRSGSGSAPKNAEAGLAGLATWLAAHPDVHVVIDGHADSSGSEYVNLQLSRRRAASIAAVLEHHGVAKARLAVRGFGTFWPVDNAPTDASWNRRVVVQTKDGPCPRQVEEVIDP
jgi:outer membrane protein OmpA-like peptidoglycan-associated protein